MKAPTANLLNAFILIAAGLYGYFGISGADGQHSVTALIPAAFGLIFLLMHKGLVNHNKIIAHVIVVLTLLLLIMCFIRFNTIAEWDAKKYIFFVCILSNLIALIAFIASFVNARKARKQNTGINA